MVLGSRSRAMRWDGSGQAQDTYANFLSLFFVTNPRIDQNVARDFILHESCFKNMRSTCRPSHENKMGDILIDQNVARDFISHESCFKNMCSIQRWGCEVYECGSAKSTQGKGTSSVLGLKFRSDPKKTNH